MSNDSLKITQKFNAMFWSWLLFSVCYWICATYKPFHVDEFYSWIYVMRCSLSDIIHLRDFGIGHPPLYHLLQKIVQVGLGSSNYLNVRIINYIFGAGFAVIFVNYLQRENKSKLFPYAIVCSAAVLDAFIFSRMYGLVLFTACLLLISGEQIQKSTRIIPRVIFIGIFLLGIAADYSFIILLPYFCLSFFKKQSKSKVLPLVVTLILMGLWFLAEYRHVTKIHESITYWLFSLIYNFSWISYEFVQLIFRFWFEEILILAVLVYLIALWKNSKKSKISNPEDNFNKMLSCFLGVFFILFLCFQFKIFRVRAGAVIFISSMLMALRFFLKPDFDFSVRKSRIVVSMFLGLLIVLMVSPVFWRELTHSRYLIALLPLVFYYMNICLPKRVLDIVAVILIISGVFYLNSNAVDDRFPPPYLDKKNPVIFTDVHCFSTQYIKEKDKTQEPLIQDMSSFDKFCKIGKIGSEKIDLSRVKKFWVVGHNKSDDLKEFSKEYTVMNKTVYLSSLDKFCFKFFTTNKNFFYTVYEFARKSEQ